MTGDFDYGHFVGARSLIVLRPLSSRGRVLIAAAIATVPFMALVSYSSADRYEVDLQRAKERAVTRAELYAALLSETASNVPPAGELARLRRVSSLPAGSALEVFDRDGSIVASTGAKAAMLGVDDPRIRSALERPSETFDAEGGDGVERIWGFAEVQGKPLTVGFAMPGDLVYGPAEDALRRDILLALAATALALLAALLLAGRMTAPIRKLAARVGAEGSGGDIAALERGVDRLGETLEESEVELARHAAQLQQVLDERNRAYEELQRLNAELEERVALRTQQLEEANQELGAFSYSVSHDLRAPLRAIDGFSRILADEHAEGLSVDALRYLALIRRNTSEMGTLIDGLLTFSHLGHQQVDKRLVDVEVLAQELVASIKAEQNGRALEFTIGSLPPVEADPTLLRQVYANLLSNAVKYTGSEDPARIEIGARSEARGTVYYVSDNGIGFDMRYSDKLFQVFQRLHSDGFDGTGLGLALVARIVHRHGGAIWAEAAPGEGATFYFTLEGGALEVAGH
jgi:signal transduction histidine kinase